VRFDLHLLTPAHVLQDGRLHERIATLGLEEPKPADFGVVGRAEENQIGQRGMSRPFHPQPVGVGRSDEVAQNRGSIPRDSHRQLEGTELDQVLNLDVAPFFLQVLGDQTAMAVFGLVLAAEEAGHVEH